MRKIYKVSGDGVAEAWIGGAAPVPAGWSLDANTAQEVYNGLREKDAEKGRSQEVTDNPGGAKVASPAETPKRRGRPPKNKA